ncbi:MAG: tetratricopeptide repeat protein [Gemmatimonadales bacterium]
MESIASARREARRREDGGRYSLRFGATALVLIAGTLVLVLVVLPERYVLRPGFRESGMSFPDPTTPFTPLPVTTFAARALPRPPAGALPGPAEAFWSSIVPLIEAGRYGDALPLFDRYLLDHPNDAAVRRERLAALVAAGRVEEAITEMERLLALDDDPADRLVLARMLRDAGRTDESIAEYRRLARARPNDVALALEHAQALAWARRYPEAATVLESALGVSPQDPRLRVELARVYYAGGRLQEARALLAGLDERSLAAAGGARLRDDVAAALYVPPPPPPIPPTLLEQAVAAREADDFQGARALLERALDASPEDPALWQAYADLLEYELGDLEGALSALAQVERLSPPDAEPEPGLQLRMAQLEIWTGRNAQAESRLLTLLAALDGSRDSGGVSAADVQAALGDLRRWGGDRSGAAARYRLALASDPANVRAREGLAALEAEVSRDILAVERPRAGGSAYSLSDTDDFDRVDLGGEWTEVSGRWAWGASAGTRWLSGLALDGTIGRRSGAFVEIEGARWWRWGTVRTALDVAAERLGPGTVPAVGASLSHRGTGVTDLRVEHGPAYPVALTLQSVLADVTQQRVALTHARPLGDRWRLAASLEGARLAADADSVLAGTPASTYRAQAALDLGLGLSPVLVVGATARSVTFSDAAPRAALPGGGSRRLFWDPRLVVAAGPYAQMSLDLTSAWIATARVSPGVAWIEERDRGSPDVVPQVAAEAGLRGQSGRWTAALDLFYSQGRFDGYRAYGARLTLGALTAGSASGATAP